ncbi:LVIVD repeat-containing protein [Myxococcus sp. Y35]|uniref:LVIVD repeat-containing protein n=1 Tax=Pseudomyxococcus flavus TaxID=3115648 RepID=UPI003CF27B2F
MTSPLRSGRALLPTLVLMLSSVTGCDDDTPTPVPDAGTQHPTDSGTDGGTDDAGTDGGPSEPWDGSYTVLDDPGDWIDRGAFSECRFTATNPTLEECEDPANFDLSSCNADQLAAVAPHGIYAGDGRGARPLEDGGTSVTPGVAGFQLFSDGGTDTLLGRPLTTRMTDGGRFFLSARQTHPALGEQVFSLAGCETPKPGFITGCYVTCRQTPQFYTWTPGTFEVERAERSGEAEVSGGLQLVSESFVELGMPADVYVTHGHAYVVSLNRSGRFGGLTVFDVSDPAHPVFKTSISLPGDSYWNGVWAKDNALYVASADTGVSVFDISNPGAPEFVMGLPGNGYANVHTVLVDGDRLYASDITDYVGSTRVYDVSTPLAPVLRQVITLPEQYALGGPHDFFAYQDRLYISNAFGGYSVMDVSDLENVRHLGQYFYPGFGGFAHHSAVGTFAGRTIAFEGGEFPGSHLRVLEVSDPANIVKIGEYRMRYSTSIHNMILKGERLYIAWYHEGLRVLNVANPTQPRQVAHFNTFRDSDPNRGDSPFEGAIGIRVPGDGYVYVVDTSRGLLIFNEL